MASLIHPRTGRPSKGKRHTFTVKLDMDRAVKLVQILKLVDMNGIAYLTPIIEAHLDAIDLDQLRNPPRRGPAAMMKNSTTSTSGTL
ncbi:hypothetical protein ACSVHC_15660 [Arthrobacter sp. KNU-44]|uniref:hypothetical protein n=1 Tax=Arthrobacter sp. KNU-44 TaxID=3450744 RepID=UPI003F43EBBD